MKTSVTGVNITILAKNHNPSIASVEWLRDKEIITEQPENFTHTPVFSLFVSTNFQFFVETDALQLSLRIINDDNIKHLPEIITKYVDSLPETPYTSIRMNFNWTGYSEESYSGFQILKDKLIRHKEIIEKVFPPELEADTKVGIIIYDLRKDYRLKLTIEPKLDSNSKEDIAFNFNFHFDVKDVNIIKEKLSRFSEIYKLSQDIVEKIIGGE